MKTRLPGRSPPADMIHLMILYTNNNKQQFQNKKLNKMKKIITITIVASVFSTAAFAQKATFGFNGGLTMSNYKTKGDDDTYTSKSKTGFTAGIVTDIPLSKSISFQPALRFTQKGGIEKENFFDEDYKLITTFNYIEVPANIIYKTNSAKTKFYIGAGPSIAFGLSGEGKVESGGESASTKVKFGSGEDDDFKGLDLGANMLAGCMFKNGVSISMNYNMGFSNLFIDGDKDNYLHNRYWSIGLGYMLKGKKK